MHKATWCEKAKKKNIWLIQINIHSFYPNCILYKINITYINIANIKYQILTYIIYRNWKLINISQLKIYNDVTKIAIYIISFILKLIIRLLTIHIRLYDYWSQ